MPDGTKTRQININGKKGGKLSSIGTAELLILALVIVLMFGGKILKNLGKSAGETIKELRKVGKEFENE